MTGGPEEVVIRFTAAFDARDIEGMAQYFAAAGVWKRPDGDLVGVAGLRAFMSRRPPGVFTRHVISNIRTTIDADGRAVVDSYVTVYRHDFPGQPVLPAPLVSPDVVGRYIDVLVKEEGSWKVLVRESIVEFKRHDDR